MVEQAVRPSALGPREVKQLNFSDNIRSVARRCRGAALVLLIIGTTTFGAEAMPSFARQTGMPCTGCHVGAFGPQLTDYGRQFKLNGYVWGDAEVSVPALSAMLLTSLSHTAKDQPGGASEGFGDNNNAALDQASLFYAGRILPKLGAFIQGTYDGIAKKFAIDNVDIRMADQTLLSDHPVVYGLSINNNPTAQDLWHTTPAWGFPFIQSGLAPSPAGETLIESLGQQSLGVTAYTMWNDLLYLDGGVYAMLPAGTQSALGVDPTDENQIRGVAPYWRLTLQHNWGRHYVAVGTFGMAASVYPGRVKSAGTDNYRDIGLDANYQAQLTERYSIVAGVSYIHEREKLGASQLLGFSDNAINTFNTFRAHATYTLDDTYGFTAGLFGTSGTQDAGLFAPDPIGGDNAGKPDSRGYLLEATFTPFGKDSSWLSPWANLRLGLQYTIYTQFNGGRTNYDGFGRNAAANNTLFASAWFAL